MVKNPPSSAGDVGLIPGWETKSLHAEGHMPFGRAKKLKKQKRAKMPSRSCVNLGEDSAFLIHSIRFTGFRVLIFVLFCNRSDRA